MILITRLRDSSTQGSLVVLLLFRHRRTPSSVCNRLQLKCASVLNQKDLTMTPRSLYKGYMSDIIGNDAAHPEWRQLCQAALIELNSVKLLDRIAHARGVILERIEDGYKKPPTSEQIALLDALSTLDSLRRITERQNGYQSKAS